MADMIAKTEAVVLRVSPFSNTSHVVTWLTPAYGKVTTIVKGACRPRSQFLGQYDLGYTCELLFYTRERNGMHVIKECSPLERRETLRANWKASFCLSYICHLTSIVSVAGLHHAELYEALRCVLEFLDARSVALSDGILWFELKLADIAGIAPRLSHCVICNKSPGGVRNFFFSAARGGLVCVSCKEIRNTDAWSVRPDTLALLHRWQSVDNPASLRNIRCSHAQLSNFRDLLGPFLVYHLDLAPECRNIAFQMIAFQMALDRREPTADTC